MVNTNRLTEHDGGYPPDHVGYRAESFGELVKHYRSCAGSLNILIDWQWGAATDEEPEHFSLYMFLPRKNLYVKWNCPIAYNSRDDVLDFLRLERSARFEAWLFR